MITMMMIIIFKAISMKMMMMMIDDGDKVEPVASMVPYMTCPGNHEWHYNFSNYRSS